MPNLESRLIKYLRDVTGWDPDLGLMPVRGLPFYLESQYQFFNLYIGHVNLTAIFVLEPTDFTPGQFQKQISKLPIQAELSCIVATSLPAYVRKRLIEMGQAFVVPGVQMFLPMLGMELRSRGRSEPFPTSKILSPATQMVLFYGLLNPGIKDHTPLSLSKALRYSTMSMSRAVSELVATKLAGVSKEGKERRMRLGSDPHELWQKAQPLLRSPVTKIHRAWEAELDKKMLLLAGESALSAQTLLGEPNETQYAVSRAKWQTLNKAGIEHIPIKEPGSCIIQVWMYEPQVLSKNDTVDPFSLFMSLRDSQDERIGMALDKVMERYL